MISLYRSSKKSKRPPPQLRLAAVHPPATRWSPELPDRPLANISWKQLCEETLFVSTCQGLWGICWSSGLHRRLAQADRLFAPAGRPATGDMGLQFPYPTASFVGFGLFFKSVYYPFKKTPKLCYTPLFYQTFMHIFSFLMLFWASVSVKMLAFHIPDTFSMSAGDFGLIPFETPPAGLWEMTECVNHFSVSCCSSEQWIRWKEAGPGLSLQPRGPTPQPSADVPPPPCTPGSPSLSPGSPWKPYITFTAHLFHMTQWSKVSLRVHPSFSLS